MGKLRDEKCLRVWLPVTYMGIIWRIARKKIGACGKRREKSSSFVMECLSFSYGGR